VPLDFGKFYDGDSYIVLRTRKLGNTFRYDAHFWLGLETSQDEAGTAAYKTVELDDYFSGGVVQHREVQGHESDLFKSYFPKGLFILHGGVTSGFHHVGAIEYKPRLLEVSGGKHPIVNEVELNISSMSSGNAYILDLGLTIIQFIGKKAAIAERGKTSQVAQSIYDDRGAKAVKLYILEGEYDNDASKQFFKAFGFDKPQPIADEIPQTATSHAVKELFDIHEDEKTHQLTFTSIAKGDAVKKSLLRTDDVFALDLGTSIFVWVGSKATKEEKRNGLMVAQHYLSKTPGRNPHHHITRVIEGHESEEFIASIC